MQFAKMNASLSGRLQRSQGGQKAAARDASADDATAILRLSGRAQWLHRHADWRRLGDWIGCAGSVVYERGSQLVGYLAATPDPPPVAWVRTIAIAADEPQPALQAMLRHAEGSLAPQQVMRIACMAASDWLEEGLPQHQFEPEQQVETLLMRNLALEQGQALRHNVEILPVQGSDFEVLAAVDRAAFANPLWWHSANQLYYAARQAINFDVAWVDGEIGGYIYGARSAGRRAHIVRVAVWPTLQSRGIGRHMLTTTIDSYRRQGVRAVSLNTQSENIGAQRLYKRLGFEKTGERYTVWSRPLRVD